MNMHSTHAELHMDSPADLDGLPDLLLARLHDQGIAAQVNATPKGTVVVDFDVSGEPNAAAAAWSAEVALRRALLPARIDACIGVSVVVSARHDDDTSVLPAPETQTAADATVWADDFIASVRAHPSLLHDRAVLVSWFADALMAGYDAACDPLGAKTTEVAHQ